MASKKKVPTSKAALGGLMGRMGKSLPSQAQAGMKAAGKVLGPKLPAQAADRARTAMAGMSSRGKVR